MPKDASSAWPGGPCTLNKFLNWFFITPQVEKNGYFTPTKYGGSKIRNVQPVSFPQIGCMLTYGAPSASNFISARLCPSPRSTPIRPPLPKVRPTFALSLLLWLHRSSRISLSLSDFTKDVFSQKILPAAFIRNSTLVPVEGLLMRLKTGGRENSLRNQISWDVYSIKIRIRRSANRLRKQKKSSPNTRRIGGISSQLSKINDIYFISQNEGEKRKGARDSSVDKPNVEFDVVLRCLLWPIVGNTWNVLLKLSTLPTNIKLWHHFRVEKSLRKNDGGQIASNGKSKYLWGKKNQQSVTPGAKFTPEFINSV